MVLLLAMVSTLAAQDPPKPAAAPASQELPPGIRWMIPLPAPPAFPPLIAGERIFVSALPGTVLAYRLADRTELWRAVLNPEKPVAVDADRLIVASAEAVHAFSVADGSLAWRTPTGTLIAPLLAKDGWVIASSETKLFAIRGSDGSVIWSRDSGPQRQRAAIAGDLLFVPLASGHVVARDLTTGEVRWDTLLGGAPAEPLVVGDRVYVGATNKHFYSIEIDDGEIDWSSKVGAEVRGQATSDGERVFYVGLDNLVRAVNRTDGAQRWQEGVSFRPFAGPSVIGQTLVLSGPTEEVSLLNVQTGDPVGKISFPERLELAPAYAMHEGAVVVAGISGGLSEAWKLWLASPAATAK